jgi:acetoacetyl-CoA reductase
MSIPPAYLDQWRAVIDRDPTGVFSTCRAIIEAMRTRNFGHIINISSVNGQSGQFGPTIYALAKAGVIGFTKTLAPESAAHGITVNAVAPEYTDTPVVQAVRAKAMETVLAPVPVGRLAKPEEIQATFFLDGDSSSFIAGVTLPVNGGNI